MLLFGVIAAGCAGTSTANRYGTIAFHDPDPQRTGAAIFRSTASPVTIEFESRPESERDPEVRPLDERILDLTPDDIRNLQGLDGGGMPGVETRAGVRQYDGPPTDPGPLRTERRLRGARLFADSRPVPLTPQAFARLWDRLVQAGIEDLPEFRGRGLPEGVPFFVLDDLQSRRIYVRPQDPELLEVWTRAKAVLLAGAGG